MRVVLVALFAVSAVTQTPPVSPAASTNAFAVAPIRTEPKVAWEVNDTKDRYRFALRKLDLRTGKAAWSAAEEDLGNHDGPPVVIGNQVVLTSRSRVISAYGTATGAQLWQHDGTKVCAHCPMAAVARPCSTHWICRRSGCCGRTRWRASTSTTRSGAGRNCP